MNALGQYLRDRARSLGLSLTEVARRAGASRQTLYALSSTSERLPTLETLIRLALVLEVHPLRLIHLLFEDVALPVRERASLAARGDRTIFIGDVTYPDGEVVLPGARFVKTWEIQNVGTVPWEGRFLQCMDDELVVLTLHGERMRVTDRLRPTTNRVAVPLTQPGEKVQLSVEFEAPSLPCTCLSYWKSVFPDGSLCFPESVGLSCKVRVMAMQPTRSDGGSWDLV